MHNGFFEMEFAGYIFILCFECVSEHIFPFISHRNATINAVMLPLVNLHVDPLVLREPAATGVRSAL